jgi:hypothetical protein
MPGIGNNGIAVNCSSDVADAGACPCASGVSAGSASDGAGGADREDGKRLFEKADLIRIASDISLKTKVEFLKQNAGNFP